MSQGEALLQGMWVAAMLGLPVWICLTINRVLTWSRKRRSKEAERGARRRGRRNPVAAALWDVVFSLAFGFFLLTIGSAAGCSTVRVLHLVDVRARAAPGGIAVFSADAGRSSVKGLYRDLGGTFTLEPLEAAALAVPAEWRIVMEPLHNWGNKIYYSDSRNTEAGSGAPLKPILLPGQIVVPDAPQLTGKTVRGTLTIYYVYPFQTGDGAFANGRDTLAMPFAVRILEPSRLRWLVERAYLLAGTNGAAVLLWALLTFGCVLICSRLG